MNSFPFVLMELMAMKSSVTMFECFWMLILTQKVFILLERRIEFFHKFKKKWLQCCLWLPIIKYKAPAIRVNWFPTGNKDFEHLLSNFFI